ncbi:unnamed protein product [Rotaria sordida]|uniref:Uncharacterized protein n=1 Tax=Rotaria sordida TaxID=392033 RepID=A0A819TKX6_9BILA|nr:unnamed protein product [Rotaria sordida]
MAISRVSKFYLACRNNDLYGVKRTVNSISANEINQFEETSLEKSTALHAALYYGHHQVVEILLAFQADSTLRNFAGLTACEEASTRDVVCAFRRHRMIDNTSNNRFSQVNSNLEWISYNPDMVKQASHYDKWLATGCNNMEFTIEDSIHFYLKVKEELKNDPDIDEVEKLFREAINRHDPDLAATSAHMLNQKFIFDAEIQPFWQSYERIAAIIARHPDLHGYGIEGSFYRGMALSIDDLLQYTDGVRILTKTFASCSRDSAVAEEFATRDLDVKGEKCPVLCKYIVTNKHSALEIEDLSKYPGEKEVLIVPFCVFEVTKITPKMFEWSTEDGTVTREEGLKIELQEWQYNLHQMMSEQAQSNRNDAIMYINGQQSNDPFSRNVESRFSPSTNVTLSSQLLSELIDCHKKRLRKQLIYVLIIFGIFGLIGLILFGISYAVPKCEDYVRECSRTGTVLFVLGLTFAGSILLMFPLIICIWSYQMSKQWSDFNDNINREQVIVWRFDGEEWIRYLNYIHGPDRQWTDLAPLSSFCCRRESYERLLNRQYGHIVLYGNGFIIDELHFISFRMYSLLGIELANFGEYPTILGLRFHTFLKAGKNSRNVYFDLFAPSSVTQEQLLTIAQSYNRNISGYGGLNTALGGLQPAASVIQLTR